MRKTLLLCALLVFAFSAASFAQSSTAAPRVRFGNIETTNATLDQILAFPRVLVLNPTCIVTGFSFSIVPKGGEVTGPLKTEGGKLTEEEINLIKKYNINNTRIFIEDIHVKCGDQEMTSNNVVVNMIKK